MPHAPPKIAYPFCLGLGVLVHPSDDINSQVSTYLAPICGPSESAFRGTYPVLTPDPQKTVLGTRC